jgi:DNA-binding transcriptional LysR family regulator
MHFDLTDLRLLVRVAEANSVTGGAEAIHISVPAASTRIKNLEENIGAKLLFRSSQGVTLTPPGQAFVHHARLVLGQIEHLRSDLQEYAKGIKGHLRVWASATAMGEFLPPVLQTYLRQHPDVNVDLRERLSHDIVRSVGEGKVDVGIVSGYERTEALQVIPYRKDRLVLVVADQHALTERQAVAFADTLAYDHVGLHEGSALRAFLQRICDDLHRSLKLRIEVSNFEGACRMIEAGVGVGVMPESAARRHAQAMQIRLLPLQDAWALREMHVCMRSLEALPAFARDLIELLEQDARSAAAATAAVSVA